MKFTVYTLVTECGWGTEIYNFTTEAARLSHAQTWLKEQCAKDTDYTTYDDLVAAYDAWQDINPLLCSYVYWEDSELEIMDLYDIANDDEVDVIDALLAKLKKSHSEAAHV